MLWSFETVAVLTAFTVAALFAVIVYVFFVSKLLPAMLLKPKYNDSAEGDRGIRKYSFEGGRAIVYEPSAPYRKYVKQYILSVHGKKKYIQCKFDSRISAVRYEVIAFDAEGSPIDTVEIEEHILEDMSCATMLHPKTAYVKLVVRSVDGMILQAERLYELPASRKRRFTAIVSGGMMAVMALIRMALVRFADQIFGYSQIAGAFGGLASFLLAFVIGLILSKLIIYLYSEEDPYKKKLKEQRKRRRRAQ